MAIILGILAIIALPMFQKTRERGLDREAEANLKLIQAAERIYIMEAGEYLVCADNDCINTNLKLTLPVGLNKNWDYRVTSGDPSKGFNAEGQRNTGEPVWVRTWDMDEKDETASCSGSGCPP